MDNTELKNKFVEFIENDIYDTTNLDRLWNGVCQQISPNLESAKDDADIITIDIDECNLFTLNIPDKLVNQFISQVFNVRYGWTETPKKNGKVGIKQTSKKQSDVNHVLDQFIEWFKNHGISHWQIRALLLCIKSAKDKPIIRNQTVIFILDWYHYQLEETDGVGYFRNEYESVLDSLLVILQDVWSAIRKACVSRLSHVIRAMTLAELQEFYSKLIEICVDPEQTWQAHEGAVMGIHCIIKKFHWTTSLSINENSKGTPPAHQLMFGHERLDGIPEFISGSLKGVIFQLLRHEQLTVREYAIKTYTTFISKSDLNMAVNCYKDVLKQLCQGIDAEKYLPDKAIGAANFTFLDPFEAESLLGICIYLVKHIPSKKIMDIRWLSFSTFRLYLSHPASTVRQAASTIFKYLVARESSNPDNMKYVLQGLCCEWVPDIELLYANQDDLPTSQPPRVSVTSKKLTEAGKSSAWEFREGRLLAYELVMQFLIKNHWLYTFGTSYLNSEPAYTAPDKRTNRRRSSLSDFTTFTQMAASKNKEKVMEEEVFCRKSGTLSRAKPASIPKKEDVAEVKVIRRPQARRYRYSVSGSNPSSELLRGHSVKSDVPLSSSTGTGPQYMFERLATVSGVANPSTHVTQKHYSYYTDDSTRHSAYSLIMACQRGEQAHAKITLSPRTMEKVTISIPDPCQRTATSKNELDRKQLDSFTTLLERILYQTIECLADERWELHRMGSQLLPCLVEVIRWFDMQILEDIWNNQLRAENTLLSYGACLSLKYSVAHAAKLQQILKHPPLSWQDHALCQKTILRIVEPMRLMAGGWAQLVYATLQEHFTIDKHYVVALETLMIIHSHFDLTTGHKYAQLNRIVTVMKLIFLKTHENPKLHSKWTANHYIFMQRVRLQGEGFLSCCIRQDKTEAGRAKQIEKYFLNEVQQTLPYFLRVADVSLTHELLPILCFYLGVYTEDDNLFKALLDSTHRLANHCNNDMEKKTSKRSDIDSLQEYNCLGLEQLVDIIVTKTLDQHTFKQLCDMYMSVAQKLSPKLYLRYLVHKIRLKLNTGQAPVVSSLGMRRRDTEVNLLLQAPDPPLGPMLNGHHSASDDEEELEQAVIEKEPIPLQESQILNASGNSAGSEGRGMQPCVESDEDEGSDWDSWDEEDEAQVSDSEFADAMKDFLRQLMDLSDADEFSKAVKILPEPEKQTLIQLGIC